MTDRIVAGGIVLTVTSVAAVAYLSVWRGRQRRVRKLSSLLVSAACGVGALWLVGLAIGILSSPSDSSRRVGFIVSITVMRGLLRSDCH